MAKFLLLLLLINYLSFEVVTSDDPADKSYFLEVNSDYNPKTGKWTCGIYNCPDNTKGCHVVIKNKEGNELYLTHLYDCMPNNKNTFETKLSKKREISIDVFVVPKAKRETTKDVYKDGKEIIETIIAVKELAKYKKAVAKARQLEKNIDAHNLFR